MEITCGDTPYGIAGGYPECTKDYITIYDGHSSQSTTHGPYCEFTKPGTIKMSSNLAKVHFYAGPSHSPSRVGVKCSFRSIDAPTPPPTTPPPTTPPPTTTPPAQCGGLLTTSSGTFQTPNWPETYPNNIDCEWRIQLPDSNMVVEISCEEEPFGIAGGLPACDRDFLKFYDGHSKQDTAYGPFCYFTNPETTKMSSNKAMAVFHAGPNHSSSRKGFKCSFRSVTAPTTPPPPPPTTPTTTPPPTTVGPTFTTTVCGGTISTSSGTFQTPNWPQTYPNNIDCEWRIQLPDSNKVVEISCEDEPFGIAGGLPACDRDFLKFYDGHSKQDTAYGPFCYFTNPETTKMSSNKAMAVFHAGPNHSPSRKGFKCSFRSVDPPPPCGETLTAASGTFQSPNYPSTYPVNIDCTWTIILPDSSKRVEIDFESPFGIAGSLPACSHTDKLHIYDDNTGTRHGPYCYFTVPNPPTMTSNRAKVVLNAGPSHSPSRRGFKANYRSV